MGDRASRATLLAKLGAVERATRPYDAEVAAAHAARWDELPAAVRTPAQLLGRKLTGCEGTHGVFPACNFGCEPCYHGSDANRVRVDGAHTVAALSDDLVWREVERGVGRRLPFRALQVGDERCNRTTWGVWAGRRYVPVFDDGDDRDLAARDAYLRGLPANLRTDPWPVKAARVIRSLSHHPRDAARLSVWALRFGAGMAGGLSARRADGEGPRVLPTTYVMHRFMDAEDVRRAWALMEQRIEATEPDIRATQERLQACGYGMAHPELDRVVPACVQHSVLDHAENQRLIQLLPRAPRGWEPRVVPVDHDPRPAEKG